MLDQILQVVSWVGVYGTVTGLHRMPSRHANTSSSSLVFEFLRIPYRKPSLYDTLCVAGYGNKKMPRTHAISKLTLRFVSTEMYILPIMSHKPEYSAKCASSSRPNRRLRKPGLTRRMSDAYTFCATLNRAQCKCLCDTQCFLPSVRRVFPAPTRRPPC